MMKNEKQFRGVFAIDLLPKKIHKNECGIVNFQKSTEFGSHWVCYFNNENTKFVEYFDSFGLEPPELLKTYLKTSNKKIMYNSTQYQKNDSVLCGYYCMEFIRRRNRGESYYNVVL